MGNLLRTENICYRYDDNDFAIRNVSAAFDAGEITAVLGGNGAGKSTFFLCCNGVLRPQSGNIYLDGRMISYGKQDLALLRQAVGLVFQDPDSQIIAGSVEGEVSFGPMNLRLPPAEVARRVAQSLEHMNLLACRDKSPHRLSGGEKKRLSIADILAMQPKIILFDEPTASLDPTHTEALINIIHILNDAGMALIISTHDVNFAYRVARRALIFAHGEIIADGEIGDVFSHDATLRAAGLKKPLLYEAYEIIRNGSQNGFNDSLSMQRPRTIDEFRALANGLFNSCGSGSVNSVNNDRRSGR